MATPEEMEASMIRNLETRTGRGLPQWLEITRASGLEKHGAIVKLLKQEHGVTHGFANLIAHRSLRQGTPQASGDDLIAAQYAGAKAGLRPIYDAVLAAVVDFGEHEVAPKKASVSLRRNKQFALVQPSTRTRVDIGISLKGVEGGQPTERLELWGAMCSHRVRLTSVDEVDAELLGWLKQAYDAS